MNYDWDKITDDTDNPFIIFADVFMLVAVLVISQITFQDIKLDEINEANKGKNDIKTSKILTEIYVSDKGNMFLDPGFKQTISVNNLKQRIEKDKSNDIVIYTKDLSLKTYSQLQTSLIKTGFNSVSYSLNR